MGRLTTTLLFLLTFSLSALAGEWPPLPEEGFISGRAATSQDVMSKRAAFSAQNEGEVIGKPLDIVIPQYAYHLTESGRIPVIIIQAEEAQGIKMLAARLPGGENIIDHIDNFELLGTATPSR